MDIYVAPEHAFHLLPQFTLESARSRVEQKKASLVAGTLGALLSRPKSDEIQLVSTESRLEPLWHVLVTARTLFDRNRTYTVQVSAPDVERVGLFGQQVPVDAKSKGSPAITLSAIEHCVQSLQVEQIFDALSLEKAELAKQHLGAREEIPDLAAFAPAGWVVVPPQVRATAVVRQVMPEVIKPVQQAQAIHEEHVEVQTLDLLFRPVYAFEYEWTAKHKHTIIELDALSGETRSGGKKFSLEQVKSVLTRDLLFDVSAEAAGVLVPGGHLAVKLVKAVMQRK